MRHGPTLFYIFIVYQAVEEVAEGCEVLLGEVEGWNKVIGVFGVDATDQS